jgi:threonine synthase
MSFFSTRGGACVTASQAILYGLAKDGGLYVPAMFPKFSLEEISALGLLPYPQRAARILKAFLEDYSPAEIDQSTQAAYGGNRFSHKDVAPVKELDNTTFILELFHGPTLAFKDMALQLLPHLTTLAAKKNGESREICILVATSGDTGKAALEGFKDVKGTSCTVFYPRDGVSPVQEMQMTTTGGSNTLVISVQGNFDDAQTGVKILFSSPEFQEKMNGLNKVLSSANSINFGRLVPQIVYYFSAYADLVHNGAVTLGSPVHFVVPTGNFGNILAAYYASLMGLPVGRLICASNRNNVLTDFLKRGVYSTQRTFYKTMSPSMDILISSNLERLLYELAGRDGDVVSQWMKELKESGSYDIGAERLGRIQRMMEGGYADDVATAREIQRVWQRHGYLFDPHTAVASHVLNMYRARTRDNTPAVIVATAHPYKFTTDVADAILGQETALGLDAFDCALRLEAETGIPMPSQVSSLRTLPVRHTITCRKEDMAKAVLEAFSG